MPDDGRQTVQPQKAGSKAGVVVGVAKGKGKAVKGVALPVKKAAKAAKSGKHKHGRMPAMTH